MKVSFEQIRNCRQITPDNASFLSRIFFVPAGLPFSYFCLRFGIGANTATLTRGVIGVTGIFMLCTPVAEIFYIGLFLWYLGTVLDRADGDVARMTDSGSHAGKCLDGITDLTFEIPVVFAIACHVWFLDESQGGLLIAAGLSLFACSLWRIVVFRAALATKNVEIAQGLNNGEPRRAEHPRIDAFLRKTLLLDEFVEKRLAFYLWDLRLGLILPLAIFEGLTLYVYAMAAIDILAMIAVIVFRLLRLFANDDVHKKSATATT